MASSSQPPLRDLIARALWPFVVLELLFSFSMIVSWWLIELIDLRVAVVMVVLRSLLWFAHLGSMLGPVRALAEQGPQADDASVRAADAALAHIGERASISAAALWFVTELGWTVLAVLDVPVEIPTGNAEIIAALLFTATAPGLASLHRMLLEAALTDMREQVGVMVVQRRLAVDRPPTSLTRPLVAAAIWMLFGGMLVSGGAAVVWNAHVAREHAVERVLLQAELAASHARSGVDAPGEQVELLTAEELPHELVDALAHANDPDAAVGFHDLVHHHAIAAVPVGDGRWAVTSIEPDEQLGIIGGVLGCIVLFALPIFAIGFSLFARSISQPIERFAAAARSFAEHGRLHELERIVPTRNDELGRLASSFNAMLDLLEQLAGAAAAVSAGNLTVELTHPGDLHDAFRGMLDRLNEIVGRLRETSLELASAAAEIGALVQQQEQAMLTQSTSIQQVAATVSSLATSAQQIADASRNVLGDAEQAVATTDDTAAQITALRRHTASIGELLQTIGEIANRSDLLALNGSLEATRAGEAGRGFSLVATEMRRLAERVTGTVEDVRGRVEQIEVSGTGTVQATERSRALAQRTAAAARDISQVTAEQSLDTEQASLGVQSVADMVVEATHAMSQTRAAAAGLRDHAGVLEQLMNTFKTRD